MYTAFRSKTEKKMLDSYQGTILV